MVGLVPEEMAMETLGATREFTEIEIVLDVAGFAVTPGILEVITQLIT